MREVSSIALSQLFAADGLARDAGLLEGCSMTSVLMGKYRLNRSNVLVRDML
jgi:hypothetical protein